jgi:hypothetical protein
MINFREYCNLDMNNEQATSMRGQQQPQSLTSSSPAANTQD